MRFRGTTPAIVILAFAAAAAARADGLDAARAAIKDGDYAKAVDLAAKVPEKSKDRPKALCVVGEAELAQEHWDAAEKAFREAIAKNERLVPALTGLGRALTAEGKLDEADKVLTAALTADNRNAGAWQAQCALFIARGTADYYAAAKTNLEQTLKLDARDPLTNRMYVELLVTLGKVDDADKAAEAYANCDKESAMSWFLRGLVLEKRKSGDKAIDAWQKAVKKDDRLRDAHLHLAKALSASDPKGEDAAKQKAALASAQRYADLGGKDKELLSLLEKLKAAAPAPSAAK